MPVGSKAKERRQRKLNLYGLTNINRSLSSAQRAAVSAIVPVDNDLVSRRIQRHLNDLEKSNYTQASSGPAIYGGGDDEDKGPSKLADDDGNGEYALI